MRLQLAIAERMEREADERYRGRRQYRGDQQRPHKDQAGGLLGAVPPDVRRAAMNLIDYQLTPVLVDQWRCARGCSSAPETPPQSPQHVLAVMPTAGRLGPGLIHMTSAQVSVMPCVHVPVQACALAQVCTCPVMANPGTAMGWRVTQ